jgi:hypothetical protein
MSEKTKIVQAFLPNLVAGQYTVAVTQEVKEVKEDKTKTLLQSVTKQLDFGVAAARFTLNSEDIYSVYPPANTTGQYTNQLPHIVFNRRTLPWERTIDGGVLDQTNPIPWMALLLLDEEDMKTLSIEEKALDEVLMLQQSDKITRPAIGNQDSSLGLKLMQWEALDQKCLVIDLSKEQFTNYLPYEADLPYLAHSKIVTIDHKDPNGIGDVVDSEGYFSVLTGNRIVRKNQAYTAVVVSLEGHKSHLENRSSLEDKIRMVVLANWTFNSYGEATFETLVQNVKIKNMTLQLPLAKGHVLEKHLAHGYVPMRHQMRNGAKNISWYKGPFAPHKLSFKGNEFITFSCSDTALYYDTDTGFLDVSIAAAWELGKIMALNNQEFTKAMVAWNNDPIQDDSIKKPDVVKKSQLVQWLNAKPQSELANEADKSEQYKPFPEVVKNYLSALARLEGIPLSYIIPDPKYLQSDASSSDALTLFYLDPKWIFALLDGAVSLSRALLTDTKTQVEGILKEVYDTEHVMGFLLHSKIVSGWRGVEIKALDAKGEPMTKKVRFERITSDIFLGIFWGEISKIVVTQPYEGLHFGIKETDVANLIFAKAIKTMEGQISEDKFVEVKKGHILKQEGFVLDINQLVGDLKTETNATEKFTSAEYAYQMIDSPIEATFTIT